MSFCNLFLITFSEYLKSNPPETKDLFAPVICASLEVLSDLGTRKSPQVEDNLVLTQEEITKLREKNEPNEPSELWIDIWRRKTQLKNIAYERNLVDSITCILKDHNYMVLYGMIEESVRKQLENLLSGETQGWGSAEKDIFSKSGGDRITTDAWH